LQAKEIKQKLRLLIEEASIIDPSLTKRLEEINRWVKDVKPGSVTAKRFVILFLQQMLQDAEVWLRLKSLPSEEEQQSALTVLKYNYPRQFTSYISIFGSKYRQTGSLITWIVRLLPSTMRCKSLLSLSIHINGQ
jgi:hypothetical protein